MVGTRIAHYQITAKLGQGGMGEVYRATDTKLDREVAIKVLPAFFAEDKERLARFEREAKTLATLQHVNIAGIHGLEQFEKSQALILELVEGEDLSERLKRGPLAVDEALEINRQIGEALEAAHDKGIIHRDLKPGNIKLTTEGGVKVLDFGLAKTLSNDASVPSMATDENSPTITDAFTQPGTILGTAAYMSPEQARGKQLDKRTDIWAFGCVLFECLTGKKAFAGEDVTDTLANIIKGEPNWPAIPESTPATIQLLLRKCLAKDRRRRLPDIAAARIDLEDAIEDPNSSFIQLTEGALQERSKQGGKSSWIAIGLAIASLLIVASIVLWNPWSSSPSDPMTGPYPVTRFDYEIPEDLRPLRNRGRPVLAVSPDGRSFVYNGIDGLYLRTLKDLAAQRIPGTEASQTNPSFSPDGQSIVYKEGSLLKRITVAGGVSEEICSADNPFGISWGASDTIVYGQEDGIWKVSANGGEPELIITAEKNEIFHGPQILPNGDDILITVAPRIEMSSVGDWEQAIIYIYSMTTRNRSELLKGHSVRYVSQLDQKTGHLVFAVENTLYGVELDCESKELNGNPVELLEGVNRARVANGIGIANYGVSNNGTLVYLADQGEKLNSLVWIDRQGQETPLPSPPGIYRRVTISRESERIALDERNSRDSLWIYDIVSKTRSSLSAGPNGGRYPIWAPASTRKIAYVGGVINGRISWIAANNTGDSKDLLDFGNLQGGYPRPSFFTPDGENLIYQASGKFWKIKTTEGAKPEKILEESIRLGSARLSPDGRWMAYMANEADHPEIFVRPFPDVDADRKKVSTAGGVFPVWSHDGSELFFLEIFQETDRLMSAVVDLTASTFSFEPPTSVMNWPVSRGTGYDVAKDGRILAIKAIEGIGPQRIVVIENWFTELNQLVPLGGK